MLGSTCQRLRAAGRLYVLGRSSWFFNQVLAADHTGSGVTEAGNINL